MFDYYYHYTLKTNPQNYNINPIVNVFANDTRTYTKHIYIYINIQKIMMQKVLTKNIKKEKFRYQIFEF